MTDIVKVLSDYAKTLPEDEFEYLFDELRKLRDREKLIVINTGNQKYTVPIEHAYLEIERIRKNKLLKENKLVRVKGVAGDVKTYSNTILFCLSPCEIDGTDIGHTWVRYSPSFKGIKYGSTVSFHSEIKRYGDLKNKSGVNWQEIYNVRIKGGDNSDIRNVRIAREEFSLCDTSLRRMKFRSEDKVATYDTLNRSLYINGEEVNLSRKAKDTINKLLLFEWLAKLDDYEFWYFTKRQ